MNREQSRLILPRLIAFSEGSLMEKDESLSSLSSLRSWKETEDFSIAHMVDHPERYRIKPEEIWVNKWKDGDCFCYESEEDAQESTDPKDYEYIAKRFVEADDE